MEILPRIQNIMDVKKNETVKIKSYKIDLIQPTEWRTKSLNREDVL